MQAAPAPVREPPILSPERHRDGPAALDRGRRVLRVDCVGHLVPRFRFDALVHSVFAVACNIECGDDLLTLVHCRLADGPTTLRLAHASATDLRLLFRAGDRWRCQNGIVVTRSVTLDLAHATVWRPAPPDARNAAPELGARLHLAAAMLAQWRRAHSSVIDREGGGVVVELREACRRLDVDDAARYAGRLVGWGEA